MKIDLRIENEIPVIYFNRKDLVTPNNYKELARMLSMMAHSLCFNYTPSKELIDKYIHESHSGKGRIKPVISMSMTTKVQNCGGSPELRLDLNCDSISLVDYKDLLLDSRE